MVTFDDAPSAQIPQFYAGRSLFITGATGFMGKVLVERLLTTCPDVDRLFLLMRSKKGTLADERLRQLKESPIFNELRSKNSQQLDKLVAISGDITLPQLGIEPKDASALKNVSIVFHSAATLKFDEPLRQALQQNVGSVSAVMDLCDSLPNMQAFVYVSTAYSNSDLPEVEERVYPAPASTRSVAALAELPDHVLAGITPQFISPKPNTYTFTKAMAETLVHERAGTAYPIAIFRPSIVVSSMRHPYPGWVENLNGPCGIVVAAGKGVLHVLRARREARADMLPVDMAIHSMLAIAWEISIDKPSSPRVYNCSTNENPTTWQHFETSIRHNLRVHPLDGALWYPSGAIVENGFLHSILVLCLHTLPLHIAEYAFKLLGIKTKASFITVSSRLQAMNQVLAFFSQREWTFRTDNMQALQRKLSPQDAALYNIDPKTIDWNEQNVNFVKGVRKYLLKEKDEDIESAKRHMWKMFFLHNGLILICFLLLARLTLLNKHVRDAVFGVVRLLVTFCDDVASRVLRLK